MLTSSTLDTIIVSVCLWWTGRTFVRHPGACLQVEPLAGTAAHLLDVVAQRVAAVLATVQAHALLEGALVAAPVRHALLVFVHQRVDEEVHGALVSTLHRLLETWWREIKRRH